MNKTQLKDTDFEGLSSEDKLYLFWQRYKSPFVVGIWVLLATVVGYQATRWWRNWRIERMQAAYQGLSTREERTRFVLEHTSHPLAGVAALELADEAFRDESFADAARFYDQAATILKKEVLAGRAALGAAMAFMRQGETQEAIRRLGILSADPHALSSIRAEAYYLQALHALEHGESADSFLKHMKTLQDSDPWVNRLELFKR